MEFPSYLEMAIAKKTKGRRKLPKPLASPSSKPLERRYIRSLMPFLESIKKLIEENLIYQLPRIVGEFQRTTGIRNDDSVDDLARIFNTIRIGLGETWSQAELKRLAIRQGLSITEFNEKYLGRNLRKVAGVDLFLRDNALTEQLNLFAINNSQLIESIATDAIKRVETLTFTSLQKGTRVETISDEILKIVGPNSGITRSRANLIARDQTAKLNADITRTRQSELGIEKYTWRTVGDDRVRDNHASKDGQVFEWSNPPADTGHPGEDYQCRCVAEPYLEGLIPEVDE